MGHRYKSAKMKKDRLSELPVEILSTIISLLPLKEAIRTSLVSKSWRFVWTNHPHLLLTCSSIIGSSIYSDSGKAEQSQKFVQFVNNLIEQRMRGPKINSFTLHYPLDNEAAANIDHWISCVVSKGVEKIDIDLSELQNSGVDNVYEAYTFPSWHLQRKECRLKHLQLASCSFGSFQNLRCLSSLATVEFRGLKISDEQMGCFLSICSSIENLTLQHCKDLIAFKFTGSKLKLLRIKHCFGLKNIEIYAKNLGTLEYVGQVVDFSFQDVPRLAQIYLSFTGMNRNEGLISTFGRFAYLPQVHTLNLVAILALNALDLPEEGVPTFKNIKQLVLTVFPFKDEDELHWISYILKAFPSLHKLELNLFCPGFTRPTRPVQRNLPLCFHGNLKELEINGFHWYKHEEALLNYLIENAVGLEVLVINPSPKVYKGMNDWVYDERRCLRNFGTKYIKLLRAVVPVSVHLEIQ